MDDKETNTGSGAEPATNEVINQSVEAAGQEIAAVDKAVKQEQKAGWHWKKPVLIGAAVFLLLLLSLGVAIVLDSGDDSTADETSALDADVVQLGAAVTLVEGTVQVSPDGETWTAATGGESLTANSHVRTLADSRAVILLDDGSALRMDESTNVYLVTSTSELVEVLLMEGQVYSRVTENPAREFIVTTPNEQYKAEGTAYKTNTDGESDGLEVYQSSVTAKLSGVEIEEGNKYSTETRKKEEIDLDDLAKDDFVQWNKEQDEKDDEFKDFLGVLDDEKKEESEPEPEPEPQPETSGIVASATSGANGIKVSWEVNGVSITEGFKVVFSSKDSTPTYPEDSAKFVEPEDRSKVLGLFGGKTYYIRVCAYRGDKKCDSYSNTITKKAPTPEVTHGDIDAELDGSVLRWEYTGKAPYGFKVVWNTSGSPTYPTSGSNAGAKLVDGDDLNLNEKIHENGTYYVRVCAYTNGTESDKCVDYSNMVEYVEL